MGVGNKLRDVNPGKGRSVGHTERVIADAKRHTDQIEYNRIENKTKEINAKIEKGYISKAIGGWLKKNI